MTEERRIKIGQMIHRLDRSFALVESGLLIFILSMMILLAFLQVILRNLFSTSFFWGDPLLRHWVLWIGFLGASLAARENRHISIDALYRILPPTWKRIVHVITFIFSSIKTDTNSPILAIARKYGTETAWVTTRYPTLSS